MQLLNKNIELDPIRCSIIIPVKYEAQTIKETLVRLEKELSFGYECLIIADSLNDPTVGEIKSIKTKENTLKIFFNLDSPGFVGAIKLGISNSQSSIVVVMMADGSDDPKTIPHMVSMVEKGFDVACASRYGKGGRQEGGPIIKKILSRSAGVTFEYFTKCGTKDATNNFKAYSKKFLMGINLESKIGFELGLELISKAIKNNSKIGEVGTIWVDRNTGASKFSLVKLIPYYAKWYIFGILYSNKKYCR